MAKIPNPSNPDSFISQFESFVEVVRILRKECPWDMKQTNESIAHLLIEETYETIEAIHKSNDTEFSGELGDLMLHVVMHAVMAEERGAFTLNDVLKKIQTKLIYRHPHVFGDVDVADSGEVVRNWEDLKLKEGQKSILQGVPNSLPSLLRAQRIQHKASNTGFDWNDLEGAWNKVEEELQELKQELQKGTEDSKTEEFGDFLFALVNAARFSDIVAEEALQKTNDKFTRRFQYIEQKAKEKGKKLKEMTLEEMDELWDEAKSLGL